MSLSKIALFWLLRLNTIVVVLLMVEPRALAQMSEVARDVFHFAWNRDQVLTIENISGGMQPTGDVASFGESRLVLGEAVIQCKFLTVFFAQGETADGVKVIGPLGTGVRTAWKVEARGGVIIERQDQVALGESIIIDFLKGAANLNDRVVLVRGPNIMRGDHLVMDLRTGMSRLDRRKYRRVVDD